MTEYTTMTIRSGGHVGAEGAATRIKLARGPWDDAELTPDPRPETAPRRRGLVGGRVERSDGWEDAL